MLKCVPLSLSSMEDTNVGLDTPYLPLVLRKYYFSVPAPPGSARTAQPCTPERLSLLDAYITADSSLHAHS